MATKQEYAMALYELDSKFQQVLNSANDENSRVYLRRLQNFIDTNKITKTIIEDLTKGKVAVNLDEFLVQHPHSIYFNIVSPEDIGVHILTMCDLIDEICNKKIIVSKLGGFLLPRCINDIGYALMHFLESAFTPLYQYLREEIEKGQIMAEDTSTLNKGITVNQTINGNGNTVTYSGRDSFINGQALKENEEDLKTLISKALQELVTATIDEDDKDLIADDLDVLNEELGSEEPKAIKFKKVKKSLDSFIGGADETLKKSIGLFGTLASISASINSLI